jgi:branched-chain amino acid transport system substrate-binding protein
MENKNRSLITLGILTIILISLIVFEFVHLNGNVTKEEKVIKVGAVLPLTGKSADWGIKTQNGINFALKEVNSDKVKIDVIYEDSGADPAKAITSTKKLIEIDHVDVLMCQLSDVCSAIAPTAQENKVVLLGFTNAPGFGEFGNYIFNLRGESQVGGKVLGEYASRRYRNAAVFYLNNPTMIGMFEGFNNSFTRNGGKISKVYIHNLEAEDFKTELIKTKNENIDVLVFLSRYQTEIILAKQARELGLNQPIIAGLGTDTKAFIDKLGSISEGIIYPAAKVNDNANNKILKEALQNYKIKYGENMPIWTAEGYDSIRFLGYAYSKGAYTPNGIRLLLAETKGFEGLSGNIEMTASRVVNKSYSLFVVRNRSFVLLG